MISLLFKWGEVSIADEIKKKTNHNESLPGTSTELTIWENNKNSGDIFGDGTLSFLSPFFFTAGSRNRH